MNITNTVRSMLGISVEINIPRFKVSGWDIVVLSIVFFIWTNKESMMVQATWGAMKGVYSWVSQSVPFWPF